MATGAQLSGVRLAGRIVAATLSLAVLVGSGWLWATYRRFDQNLHREGVIGASTRTGKDIDGKDQNILMIGSDDRSSATKAEQKAIGIHPDGGANLTDTMMLLHVPANGKKASAVSFPRDSWVAIPGHGMDKLNAAFGDGVRDAQADGKKGSAARAGGYQLLVRTLQNLTGLTIDHFVAVDLLGFYRISNAIGGVQVCLRQAQNASTEGDASHPEGYSGINLKKGENTIEGKQALAFVRQRHGLPRGDLDRIVRQQTFLSAVFKKVTTAGILLNPIKLQNLLKAVDASLTMDGNSGAHKGMDPLALAKQLQNLSAGKLTFHTLPTKNGTIDGLSVQLVDTEQVPVFVGQILGVKTKTAYAKAIVMNPKKISVSVINGTPTAGLASKSASTLSTAGFITKVGGNAQATAKTVIEYPAGSEAQAKTLALYVPGVSAVASAAVSVVTLVLGTDGKRASATRSVATTPTRTTTAPKPSSTAAKKTASDRSARTAANAGCIN